MVLRQNDIFRWRQRWRWPPTLECTWWTIGLLLTSVPCAFDDCLRAYHWLVTHSGADPQTLVVLGDSAGGNLSGRRNRCGAGSRLSSSCPHPRLSPLAGLASSVASRGAQTICTRCHSRDVESTVGLLAVPTPRDPRCSAIFAACRSSPDAHPGRRHEMPLPDATQIRDAAPRPGRHIVFM